MDSNQCVPWGQLSKLLHLTTLPTILKMILKQANLNKLKNTFTNYVASDKSFCVPFSSPSIDIPLNNILLTCILNTPGISHSSLQTFYIRCISLGSSWKFFSSSFLHPWHRLVSTLNVLYASQVHSSIWGRVRSGWEPPLGIYTHSKTHFLKVKYRTSL